MRNKDKGQQTEVSGEVTVKEAGRRGGTATRERHGIGFYRQIGAKGGESTKKLYGHLFSELGKRGGRPKRPTLDNAGRESPERKEAKNAVGPESSLPA